MKDITKTVEKYPLDKVNERISYYTELVKFPEEGFISVNKNLLTFWENYKLLHYPDEKTNS